MGDIIGLVMASDGWRGRELELWTGDDGSRKSRPDQSIGKESSAIHTASKTPKNLWMCLKMLSALKKPGNFGGENE